MIPTLGANVAGVALAARGNDVADMIALVINLGIPLTLFLLGWFIGGRRERAHLRDLARREAANADIVRTDLRAYAPADAAAGAGLVVTEVVIGADYCKAFLAGLRKLVGGNMRSYETLLERARREAIMRLVEQARSQRFNALCCVRVETSSVGKGIMPMVAVLASATAYRTSAA